MSTVAQHLLCPECGAARPPLFAGTRCPKCFEREAAQIQAELDAARREGRCAYKDCRMRRVSGCFCDMHARRDRAGGATMVFRDATYAAPASGTYSNLFEGMKPLAVDDVKRMIADWRKPSAPKPNPAPSGRPCPCCGGLPCRLILTGTTCARYEREQRRREIDKVLAEDARRFPAFATARRCAVMAACEAQPDVVGSRAASRLLHDLHAYEHIRGGARAPSAAALRADLLDDTERSAYERARSL